MLLLKNFDEWAHLTYHRSEQSVELVDPGQAEVGEFDDPVARDEQVLWLQIAMDDAMTVKKVDAAQDLPDDVLKKNQRMNPDVKANCCLLKE